jgi:peptidoglycan/xylan/chitin deacetylase (PgdA/CDA1 family)
VPQVLISKSLFHLVYEMAAIRVLLTFDDGPHAAEDPDNSTAKALSTLSTKNCIAVFFVQTHAENGGAKIRMNNPQGAKWSKNAFIAKHLIQVHTGSKKDHEYHTVRAKAKPDNLKDGNTYANGLESDLVRAKKAIMDLVGRQPKFVRATYLERNKMVNETYAAATVDLKHIGAHVVSGDADPWTIAEQKIKRPARYLHRRDVVKRQLHERMKKAVEGGATDLIVLFHELHPVTVRYLAEFIDHIKSFTMAGHTFTLVDDSAIALQILENTNI